MPKITISIEEGSEDCETCGWYSWQNTTVFLDGKEILSNYYDGHLGNGDGNAINDFDFIEKLLDKLGFETHLESTTSYA